MTRRFQFSLRAMLLVAQVVACIASVPVGFYVSMLVSYPVLMAIERYRPGGVATLGAPSVEGLIGLGALVFAFFFAGLAALQVRHERFGFGFFLPASLAFGAFPAALLILAVAAYSWLFG